MDQIRLAVVNTIRFTTILTLIRRPMYHFRVQVLVATSNTWNTLRAYLVFLEYKFQNKISCYVKAKHISFRELNVWIYSHFYKRPAATTLYTLHSTTVSRFAVLCVQLKKKSDLSHMSFCSIYILNNPFVADGHRTCVVFAKHRSIAWPLPCTTTSFYVWQLSSPLLFTAKFFTRLHQGVAYLALPQ